MSDNFQRFSEMHVDELRARWGLGRAFDRRYALLGVTDDHTGNYAELHLSLEEVYELREAVNDLYDHIREKSV